MILLSVLNRQDDPGEIWKIFHQVRIPGRRHRPTHFAKQRKTARPQDLYDVALAIGNLLRKLQKSAKLPAVRRWLPQFSSKIPMLPDEALTRESLYRDRD